MDCKEFEKMIPDFLDDKLDFLTLEQFNQHLDNCPDCREELTIHFLVTEGIQRLEEGDAFDLQKELEQKQSEAEKKVVVHRGFLRAGELLEILAVAAMILGIAWIIM